MRLALNFPSWSDSTMIAASQRRFASVFSSTFSMNRAGSSPWRASPESPGILMSDTTRSKGALPSSSSACSAVDAVVAAQSFDATADARKRSTGALSSTSRTRRVSGGISPVSLSCVAVLLVTDCLLGSGREPVRLFCPVELVEELEPLTREAVFREMQRLELRVVRVGLFALRHHRLRAGRRGGLRRRGGGVCRGRGGQPWGRRGG